MRIENIEVLVISVEVKQGKNNSYLLISFVDISTGQLFTVVSKDIELIQKIKNMSKYIFNLSVSSSKFGIQLNLDNIVKFIGTV